MGRNRKIRLGPRLVEDMVRDSLRLEIVTWRVRIDGPRRPVKDRPWAAPETAENRPEPRGAGLIRRWRLQWLPLTLVSGSPISFHSERCGGS